MQLLLEHLFLEFISSVFSQAAAKPGASSLAPPKSKGRTIFWLIKSLFFLLILTTGEYFSLSVRIPLHLSLAEVQVQLSEICCRSGLASKLIPVPLRFVLFGTHFSSLKYRVLQ